MVDVKHGETVVICAWDSTAWALPSRVASWQQDLVAQLGAQLAVQLVQAQARRLPAPALGHLARAVGIS